MLRDIDNYFLSKDESVKSCLMCLRSYLGDFDPGITEEWKYRMPFYYYKGKMLCYLWTDKKTGEPYIGFADGYKIESPNLVMGERARMKILPVNSHEDVPVAIIETLLLEAISHLY